MTDPKILTTATKGDRVRVHVYMHVPRSKGSSAPLMTPWTLPGTVIAVYNDRLTTNGYQEHPEYMTVEIDNDLYSPDGPYPFDRQQLALVSRREIHADDCRCHECY